MKLLALILAFLLPHLAWAQSLDVKLLNIRYYASTKCGDENPVLVKICFSTTYPTLGELNVVVVESNPKITYTGVVSEYDAEGHVYYSFCTKDGESNSFDMYFRDPSGVRSNTFSIFAKSE